ncbi:hypothetical protein I4U23_012672 [Adineta vaga]|nr:hypothetical protein I4U23_012672 [Adineta vaga]
MLHLKVDEQCMLIKNFGPNISIEQLKQSFDIFLSVLEQIDSRNIQNNIIDQIICSLANTPYRNKKLTNFQLITHELVILIRNKGIIDLLYQRKTTDEGTQELLLNTSTLFVHLSSNIDDTNRSAFKDLFFHKSLIDALVHCLKELTTYGRHLEKNAPLFRSIGFLLVIFKHCHDNHLNKKDCDLIMPIFFTIIQCLCSSYAIDIIRNLEFNFIQILNDDQTLFLNTMPWYLQWYCDSREGKHLIKVHRILLTEYTNWITNCHPDSYYHCSSKFATMLRHLSYFLVRPIELDNINQFSDAFYPQYSQLVSYWSTVLASTLVHSFEELNIKFNIRIIIQNLYNFTLHRNILNFMKTIPNLISMLFKIADVENDDMQLNAYRCLGKLMDETDIKTMTNPGQIVLVHMEFLTKSIGDPHKAERFYSLLESLKNFVQHDQVKTELIKQHAVSLLIKCVVDIRFDSIKVQQIALEILLALSFDNNACLVLKQDDHFIDHIRLLTNKTNFNQLCLQRAAEGLLWKLEKEEEAITKVTKSNSYQYDIMISYSHKDQKICRQIHQQLVKDGFRVWFDKDCLRGSTMIGMANAIENSECVLVCMSTYYKQSVYCQSEAHYAFERGCHLIPIIVESNYKPDGWLGIIVSGKIYVDFMRMTFQSAYDILKNEINEQQQQLETSQISNQSLMRSESTYSFSHTADDLPTCIIQWTDEHVRSFLHQIRLENSILLLCSSIDGQRLLNLYEMCLLNRETMYQSLKFELNEKHHVLLPVADYICFLDEIQYYVPFNSTNVKSTTSAFLSITFCNIM